MKKHMKNSIPDTLGRLLLALALFYGLAQTVWDALALNSLETAGTVLTLFGAVVCLALCAVTGKRGRLVIYAVLMAALAVTAILASGYIGDGWSVVFNRIFSGFELRRGRIFQYFKSGLTEGDPNLCAAVFLVYPAALLAVCAARTACARTVWRFAFPIFAALLWVGAVVFRLPVSGIPPVIFGLAAVGMRARSIMLKTSAPDGGRAILPVLLSFVLIAGVFALPVTVLAGNDGRDATALRRAIAEKIHDTRYHVADSAMPEGDFSKLGDFAPPDTAALYVTTDNPKPMYLRGYSGDVYTGNGWDGFTRETLGKYAASFSWLHAADFFGQTQYAALTAALGTESETRDMEIENVSACSAYEFMPYELAVATPDANAIGDIYIRTGGLRGERTYSIGVSSYPIENCGSLQDLLFDAGNAREPAAYEYLQYEGAYREFVYNEYLAVPPEARAAVRGLTEPLNLPEDTRVAFAQAQKIVLYCLLNNYEYNETPEKMPADRDFAVWFLEEGKSGYAPHFATAAVLLFRELGIPARYVEGYTIRSGDVLAAQNGRIEVPETNAHAWVEIYRDGVGFVPFEVTPPFVSDSPVSSSSQSGGAGSSGPIEEPPEEEFETEAPITFAQLLLMLLILLLLLLVAALVYMCVRRHVIKKRRDKLLNDPDNAQAVCWLTAYAVTLLGHIGVRRGNGSLLALVPEAERLFGAEFAAAYERVVYAQRGAMFSPNAVPDDIRAAARTFTDDALTMLRATCSFGKKLRLRWILCVC
jgi:transglutaminase-like putative cysteine protease